MQDLFRAVSAYRGELLPGFYDEWVGLERQRLESAFEHRMQRLLDALIDERRWPEVLEWGERWVALGAIARVGRKDRAAIRDAIFATTNYTGVLGTWSFTPTGDTTLTTIMVRQVHHGAWDPATVQVINAP